MPLTELNELIGVISRKKISDTDIFDTIVIEDNDPQYQLYVGLKKGIFQTQEEAAEVIYNSSPNDNSFKKIKSRLKQRLIDVVFSLDLSKDGWSSEYQRASQEVTRAVAQVRLLIQHGAVIVAKEQAQRLLTLSIKHSLTESAVILSRLLRNRTALSGDIKLQRYYADIHKKYKDILNAEERCEAIMDEFAVVFAASTDDHPEMIPVMRQWSEEIAQLRDEYPSFLINMHYYRIHIYTAHVSRDYEKAIQFGRAAIEYLAEHPDFSSKVRIAEFTHGVMNALYPLGKFDEAEKIAPLCFENYIPFSNNWYSFIVQYFTLALHSANYVKAAEIFRMAAGKELKMLPKHKQEEWKLYAGYLLYLHQIEYISLSDDDLDMVRHLFKREKFSFIHNYDLEVYTKDKTGLWIMVLILELLYTIEDGKANRVLALQEKLRLYYFRALKPNLYPRANAFFHIVHILLQKEFNLEKVYKFCAEDLILLGYTHTMPTSTKEKETIEQSGKKNKAQQIIRTTEGTEIIRYEALCHIIFERIARWQKQGKFISAS